MHPTREIFLKNLANWLCHWATHGPASFAGRMLLIAFNKRVIPIASFEGYADQTIPLTTASDYKVAAPDWPPQKRSERTGTHPPLTARLFLDAIASPYSPCLIAKGKLLFPDEAFNSIERIEIDPGRFFYYHKRSAVTESEIAIKGKTSKSLESAILINASGAANWYHFIIQCLPKLHLSKLLPTEHKNYPILAPAEARSIRSFSEALDLFSSGNEIVYLERGETARVGKLIVLDEPCSEPYNLYRGLWPAMADYRHHRDYLLHYIDYFRSRLPQQDASSSAEPSRLFLARPPGRRNYNQDELIAIAEKFGFTPAYPETLPLEKQIALFRNAKFIAGPSGAAWTGIIFREQSMSGLSWLISEYAEFCTYSNLAELLGHKLTFIAAKTPSTIRSTYDGYLSEYHICPNNFEIALRTMLSKT